MVDVEVSEKLNILGQNPLTLLPFCSQPFADVPKLDSFIVAASDQIMFVEFQDFH
jgi:hypothetical protein